MSDVAVLESEVKEFKFQLETVQSSLQVDPDNSELQSLQTELQELISLTETAIAEQKPQLPSSHTPTRPAAPPTTEKRPKEISKTSNPPPPPDEPTRVSYSVNETVLARWASGDNSFYPARITSITGSASNPVYFVSFKSYSTVETLTAKDIKPASNSDSRKRKADASSGPPSVRLPTFHSSHPSVISAAAEINPALASQARKEPSKATDGPPRPPKMPRKVKANKELEEGKMKWKDFASKGKILRKDSMFRTGESPQARVGFTGSGQQMRKDPTRTRHVYQQHDDEGY